MRSGSSWVSCERSAQVCNVENSKYTKSEKELQKEIRETSDPIFLQRSYFQSLYEEEQLLDPSKVADYLFKLFTQTTVTEFIEHEWDIRQHPIS